MTSVSSLSLTVYMPLTLVPIRHSLSKKAIIQSVTCPADERLRSLTEQPAPCNGSGTNRGSRGIDKSSLEKLADHPAANGNETDASPKIMLVPAYEVGLTEKMQKTTSKVTCNTFTIHKYLKV